MPDTISLSRKFLICFTAALIAANTAFRIVNRLSWERGSGPAVAIALAAVIFLSGLIYPFIWHHRTRRGSPAILSFWRNILCYGIAFDLALIGIQKLFGLQGHVHIALLDSSFSSLSGEDLSWAYYGRSPAFFNCIGVLQVVGSLFLVFPRTRMLGVFTLLPILVNICLTGYFYNFSPGEPAHAFILILGLFYLLAEDSGRVLSFFFRSVAPASISRSPFGKIALRLSVVYIPLLLIIACFHLPDKDPVHGKYKVTRLWVNDRAVDLDNCADSVLTVVYLDEGKDCVFEYNGQQRRLIGDYKIERGSRADKGGGSTDDQNDRIQIIWHYPAGVRDTLFAQFINGPGSPQRPGISQPPGVVHLDGRMGNNTVRWA